MSIDRKIFSRWGKLVYEESVYKNSWDGTGLPNGSYYYLLSAAGGQTWKGWVEIIR